MAETLRGWLGGRSVASFAAEHWERAPLHVARNDPTAFAQLLRLDDIDALLCRHALIQAAGGGPTELLTFEAQRETHRFATAHAAFASGASLVLNHADKLWPPLNALCASLADIFRHAYANLYLTPHGAQTAPPHSDDRDVFILQVAGAKVWRIWPPGTAGSATLPFADEQFGKGGEENVRVETLGEPALACKLATGDVLYVPRGAPHVAAAADGAPCSLHLTIAVPTADLCWSRYVTQAAANECLGRLHFRRALPIECAPPAGGAEPGAGGYWRATFDALWAELHASVTAERAEETLSAKMSRHARQQREHVARVDAAAAAAEADGAAGVGGPAVLPLRCRSVLRKVLDLELFTVPPQREGGPPGLVAQTVPLYGGRSKPLHTKVAPELADAVAAVARGLERDATFKLGALPARHDFLRACAARLLLRLEAVERVAA